MNTTLFRLAAAYLLLASPAVAQKPAVDPMTASIEITQTAKPRDREPIAVPNALVASEQLNPMLESSAIELTKVLADDLRYSGVFDVVPDGLYAQVSATSAAKVPYDEWVAIGASWLALLTVSTENGELVVEGRLFETKLDRKMVLGKRYTAKFEAGRRVAHTFADLVVGLVGGEPGVANTRLTFVSDRDGGRDREIYIVDYDGHQPQRITANRKLNVSPDWSPTNDRIVYTSYIRGNPDLYIIPKSGGANQILFNKKGMNTSPAWAPDGNQIAFASSFESKATEIYTIRPNGKGLRRLTTHRGIDTNPSWSPTGRQIAFTSDRSGRPHIWLMDADGLNQRRVTRQGVFNDGASWAPKGRDTRLLYAGMSAGAFHIFLLTIETDTLIQLTDVGSNEAPSWSPDGRQVAFASTRGGSTDIYIMNDDGSNLRRITRGGRNMSPSWSH